MAWMCCHSAQRCYFPPVAPRCTTNPSWPKMTVRGYETRFKNYSKRHRSTRGSLVRTNQAPTNPNNKEVLATGLRCGEFPIPMWLNAESTRMQFTRFPGRYPTGGTAHGVYLLHAEFLGFHSAFVFLLRRWLNRQEENLPFCSVHIPFRKPS
jgi:hypothetical protein